MYIGSYHRAARRAADAISAPGDRVMILSARYGLLDPADRILRYEMRLSSRWAITAQGLREQAEQLGVLDTAEVVVLASAAYANLAAQVWPHARLALAGTRGIGDQMARFAALATGRATIADIVLAAPGGATPEVTPAKTGDLHAVGVHGGKVHLAGTAAGPTDTPAPACGAAGQRGCRWRLTTAEVTCTRCAAIMLRRRALHRWCAMVDRAALAVSGTPGRSSPAARVPGSSERQIGPAPRRPATRRPGSRCRAGRRRGDARRRGPSRWQHAPARPYPATPLTWTAEPGLRRRPRARHRYPRGPRPSIGRAPPPMRGARRWPNRAPAGRRPVATPPAPR